MSARKCRTRKREVAPTVLATSSVAPTKREQAERYRHDSGSLRQRAIEILTAL